MTWLVLRLSSLLIGSVGKHLPTMVIDEAKLLWAISGFAGVTVVGIIGFSIRKIFIDRIDVLGVKMEALVEEIHKMALESANDRAKVRERIAHIETILENR